MNKHFVYFFLFFTIYSAYCQEIVKPSASQLKWHKAEFGVIFHYDLHVFDNKIYNQTENRIFPIEDYNIFNPEKLDTDQWIRVAKQAGAKFAVITATHETGFALFQSEVNPYCLKALRWRDGKGDIVDDFVKSCRKYGLMPGIYIGIRWNSLLGIHNFKVEGNDDFAKNRQKWYRKYCEKLTEELCSKYGELFLVWFDGGADNPKELGPDVEPIIRRLQPQCLFYHNTEKADFRWGGSESGTVGYPNWSTFPTPYSHNKILDTQSDYLNLLKHGDANGKYWVPAMADAPLRGFNGKHDWFWEPNSDDSVEPLSRLEQMYYNSVGRNATLILGLAPNSQGIIAEKDALRLKEFGDRIRQITSYPIAVSDKNNQLEIIFPSEKTINQVILQEDISQGERIKKYKIEGFDKKKWFTLCEGESVGHKRIQKFTPVKVTRVRWSIEQAKQTPIPIHFSVHNTPSINEQIN